MKFNNLKSAWHFFKYQQSLDPLSEAQILQIIDVYEQSHSKYQRLLINSGIFLLFIFFCQAG